MGQHTTLDRLLFGPTSRTDGTENLIGALRTCMGSVGAETIRNLQQTEMVDRAGNQDRGQALPDDARLALVGVTTSRPLLGVRVSELLASSFPRSVAGISLSAAPTLGTAKPRAVQVLGLLRTSVPSTTRYPRQARV